MNSRISAVWAQKSLHWHLVGRYLKKRYERATLGYLWSLLEPALLTAVYYFIFSLVGRFGVEDYALFIMVAMLPWLWFAQAANASTGALTSERRLITTVYVPREVFPLSLTTAKGVDFAMSLPVIPVVALALQHPPSWYLALLPLAMAIQWVLVAGVTLALSALGAVFGDVERAIRVAMRVMFYTTPVVYPFDRIDHEGFATALEILNPMVGLVRVYRAGWFPESFPGWWVVGWSAASSLIILVIGWRVFARMERQVLKEL